MLNATTSPGTKRSESVATPGEEVSILRIHGDFQNICSYIYPDLSQIVSLGGNHIDLLKKSVPNVKSDLNDYEDFDLIGPTGDNLGVPLLLPLTIGIEFEQKVYASSPKTRTLSVNVDSLSMMLSTEDSEVIDSVIKKWMRKSNSQVQSRTYVFDVIFDTERLGIGLRKEGGKVVVDHVGVASHQEVIESGDVLHAINGILIANGDKVALSDMVRRLATEPRPLTITFARNLSDSDQTEDLQAKESGSSSVLTEGELYQGTYDSLELSLASAVVTIMEKEVTLFRGNASSFEVGCKLSKTNTTVYRIDVSSKIQIDYYNLRVWGWEPFLEPGGLFLSAEYQEPRKGPRELSIELGDRPGGPLCFNVTDAVVETVSRFWEWRRHTENEFEAGNTFLTVPDSNGEAAYVSRKAANAALTFAQRQKQDSAKPCIFRNRSGVSVAFVQQKKESSRDAEGLARSGSFVAVGEYCGLQGFKSSDVTVVSNGEETKFRVDVLPGSQGAKRARRFPPLTVALQAVTNVQVQPLVDLEITRAGETTLPLSFKQNDDDSAEEPACGRHWVSWSVEQSDERTVLTLGSSIRVVSLLQESIDVGVEIMERGQDEFGDIKPVGTCRCASPLFLPVWLGMKRCRWRCCARVAGGSTYLPLFTVSEEGTADTEQLVESYLEFPSLGGQLRKNYLAVSAEERRGILTVFIDCAMTLRNLLPTSIQWELTDSPPQQLLVVDGIPSTSSLNVHGNTLASGGSTGVFSEGFEQFCIRFCITEEPAWSTWVSLSLECCRTVNPSRESSPGRETNKMLVTRCANIADSFGFSLPIGVRITKKDRGVVVVVHAELWFTNLTSLPLVFGCPQEHTIDPKDRYEAESGASELSAAEAALKEISSLFESGEDGKAIERERLKQKARAADIIRIPAQNGPSITEECFEYIEVDYSTVKRRWWASESHLSPRENITEIEEDGTTWHWLDNAWVSSPM